MNDFMYDMRKVVFNTDVKNVSLNNGFTVKLKKDMQA